MCLRSPQKELRSPLEEPETRESFFSNGGRILEFENYKINFF